MGRVNKGFENEIEEDEEEDKMLDDDILELRVYKNGQFSLMETLDRINASSDDEQFETIDLKDLEEFSSVGGGSIQGYSLPLGMDPEKPTENKNKQ